MIPDPTMEDFIFSTSVISIRHTSHAYFSLFLLRLFSSVFFFRVFLFFLGRVLYIFTSGFGPSLFFLAIRLVRDEDTYGEVPALRAVLVLHQDAVLAAVRRVHAGDEEVGELARLELEDDVPVRCDLLVVLQPGDLWHGVTRDVAGETESLREETATVKKNHAAEMKGRWRGARLPSPPVWSPRQADLQLLEHDL